MVTKHTMFLFIIMLISIIIVGCTPMKNGLTQELPEAFTPTVALTPSSTHSPTASATVIMPTLEPSDANELLLELIKSNGNCKLPCLWGITPGFSTTLDAYQTLSPLAGITKHNYFSQTFGTLDFEVPVDDLKIIAELYYQAHENGNSIELVEIRTKALRQNEDGYDYIFGSSNYSDLFNPFSLQSILFTYGRPTQVYLDAAIHKFEPTAPTFFYIYLSYPEKGIFVRFTTNADEIVGEKVRSCPTEATIDLWLMIPSDSNSIPELLINREQRWGYVHKSLEESVQMSIDQFYETFNKPSNQCLETPRAIWEP
jgi:hypothetical protein